MQEIGAREAAEALKGDRGVRLLDVRQPWEHETARIPGAQLLTRALFDEMLATWPKDTPIICHCHHGVRSLNAAAYLEGQGFTNCSSLAGGIEAWSIEVDPSVPRY